MSERLGPLLFALLLTGCGSLAVRLTATATPVPTPEPTPTASPRRTPEPRQAPTPDPTATPTPTPDPSVLALRVTGCEGGVVLEWTPTADPDFHHYTALRSPEKEIAPDWPPIAPAVDWGDTYATDPYVTSAIDASIIPSDTVWNYRVMAYDADGKVIASSSVASAQLYEPAKLGSLDADVETDGVHLRWTPYRGRPGCFNAYQVLVGSGGRADTLVSTISDPTAHEMVTDALERDGTYAVRVQAVHTTALGTLVLGTTSTAEIEVP